MTGPSLLKHEKDLKLLETHLEDVRNSTMQKENEYKLQMANLATQMTEMGNKVNSLAAEMKADRQDLSTQIKDLVDVMRFQTAGKQNHSSSSTQISASSVNTHTTPPVKTMHNSTFSGGNGSQKLTNNMTPPIFMNAPPVFMTAPPFTLHNNTQKAPVSSAL